MKTDELEKLPSNLVKGIITACNRSLSNILCARFVDIQICIYMCF